MNGYRFRGNFFSFGRAANGSLRIRQLDPTSPTDLSHHDQLVTLVQRMLDLRKRLPELKSAQDRTVVQRQIEATDREIDRLVYTLYELTEEEIGIVEGRGG